MFLTASFFLQFVLLGSHAAVVPAGADTRAVLMVTMNEVVAGESLVVLRSTADASDALVPIAVFRTAGVSLNGGNRERVGDTDFVSLASLGQGVTYLVDDETLTLRITLPAAMLGPQRWSLRPTEPAGTTHPHNGSAFLNYAASWSGGRSPGLSGEVGWHTGRALVTSVFSRTPTGAFVRGLTTMTVDNRSSLRRWTFGDATLPGSVLSGAAVVAGVSVGREFSLDPYFVRYPTPRLSETLTSPSIVDVYVNGRLVRRAELAPGVLDVTGIPATAGPGRTQLVIRDAFGQAREVATDYYVTSSVLAAGLTDYHYGLGFRRAPAPDGGANYGDLVFEASHRAGVSDEVTIGGRVEGGGGAGGFLNGGPLVNARVGRMGAIEIAARASRNGQGRGGGAAAFSWTYTGRPFGAGVSVRATSAEYVSMAAPVASGSTGTEFAAFVSVPVPVLGSITIQDQRVRRPSAAVVSSATITHRRSSAGSAVRLSERTQVVWSAARVSDDRSSGFEGFVGLNIGLGASRHATAAIERRAGRTSGPIELQQPLSTGAGIGYRVRGDIESGSLDADVRAQTGSGRYELLHTDLNGSRSTLLTASGGVTLIGRSVTFTRPVQDSYALVRVPGVPGVRVYSNNLEVGRTNARGNLLVPALLANYANRLSISDEDVPVDRAVPDGEQRVAPPWRGGALVTFGSAPIRAWSGDVAIDQDGTSMVPAFGRLTVTNGGATYESPIGRHGEVLFEELPIGSYVATIQHLGNTCTFSLTVAAPDDRARTLGHLVCLAHSK